MLAVAWMYVLLGKPNRNSHYGVGELGDGRWAFAWGPHIWAHGLPDALDPGGALGYELYGRESAALAAMRREVETRGDELAAGIVSQWEREAICREPLGETADEPAGAARALEHGVIGATPAHKMHV